MIHSFLTLIRVASQPTRKEWLVGILIPTDVGLLKPTPQCHAFSTVLWKNGKNVWLWELGWGTERTQISVENLPVVVYSLLDLNLKPGVNPLKTWPWLSSQSIAILPRKAKMRRVPKEWHWYLKTAEATQFLFIILPFSWWKLTYSILIQLKKNGHTIFLKIFSLWHHGIKPFFTKVGI